MRQHRKQRAIDRRRHTGQADEPGRRIPVATPAWRPRIAVEQRIDHRIALNDSAATMPSKATNCRGSVAIVTARGPNTRREDQLQVHERKEHKRRTQAGAGDVPGDKRGALRNSVGLRENNGETRRRSGRRLRS